MQLTLIVYHSGMQANPRSIIFSCWTRTLHLVSRHLRKKNIPFLCIDGNCPLQKRQENLEMFEKSNEKPVLIMTTGTGAFGYVKHVTLPTSDVDIFP